MAGVGGTSGIVGFRLDPNQVVGLERIDGLREVQRDLRKLGDDTKTELKSTHLAAAEIVVMGAKRYVPYRTGRLAESIRALATNTSGRVRAGSAKVPYAGPIHFGWPARRIAPQPFIYDALDVRREEIRQLYDKRIDELIGKYDLQPGPIKQLRATKSAAGTRSRRTMGREGRLPDALLRDKSGNVIGGIYDTDVVYF